jgi:hypothetical protein
LQERKERRVGRGGSKRLKWLRAHLRVVEMGSDVDGWMVVRMGVDVALVG